MMRGGWRGARLYVWAMTVWLLQPASNSESQSFAGTIEFRGAIVAPSCVVTPSVRAGNQGEQLVSVSYSQCPGTAAVRYPMPQVSIIGTGGQTFQGKEIAVSGSAQRINILVDLP
ncbi:hypothetical protein KSF73_01810 [Burkholderiaceae bacterium DAT-1]|nr:hypothetical protein [Burkholderiaceae bacterium DAT-1]